MKKGFSLVCEHQKHIEPLQTDSGVAQDPETLEGERGAGAQACDSDAALPQHGSSEGIREDSG